ncbi:MAG: tetratricopeptide repeat protein [Phycisphaerae bacterium]|nr:tetratricopeptide repeat protein [Phycisphaerae bacterium]
MKKLIIAGIVVLITSGCENLMPPVSKARIEANTRWNATRAQMLYGVAKEHFKVGQLDACQEKLTKALELSAECVDARLLLGKVHIERGKPAAALRELHRAMEASPRNPQAQYLLGVALEKGGRLAAALEAYRQAYALDKTDLAPVRAAAEVLVQMGQIRRAQVYIDSYLPQAGNDPAMFEVAGRIAAMCGDDARAADAFRQALALDSENDDYRRALGRAQFRAGRYEQAVETLSDLVASGPQPVWVSARLGDCYLALNRPDDAFDAYERAREADDSPALTAKLAKASLAAGRRGRAIHLAQTALSAKRDCGEAILVLGYALVADGQPHRARDLLRDAAGGAHSDDSTVWCLLGRAQAACGDEAEAVRCYTEALRRKPDNALARALLDAARIEEVSRAAP